MIPDRLDYELIWGLEEWKDNRYKITEDFYRLKVYTERMARFLHNETGKDIPVGSVIKLTYDEMKQLNQLITEAKKFTGLFGAYRAKAFDLDCFYEEGKDGLATEDELKYDYIFNEL